MTELPNVGELKQRIEAAKKRMGRYDAMDRRAGFATPQECSCAEHAATALAALNAALVRTDWDTATEALLLLASLAERLRRSDQ